MDVYCLNCGEPWDIAELKDFTEEDRQKFMKGRWCPSCGGKPTYFCVECREFFKGWMEFDELVKAIVWDKKMCPYCGGKLRRVEYTKEFMESIVSNDGAIEEVLKLYIYDYI